METVNPEEEPVLLMSLGDGETQAVSTSLEEEEEEEEERAQATPMEVEREDDLNKMPRKRQGRKKDKK